MDYRVVIPARFASSRLPGKPLREINGRPMIAHVVDRARESNASEVVVCTDDERILHVAADCGVRAVMTRADHVSGTDRLAEVAEILQWADDDVVVNLQGDEPCVPGRLLDQLAGALSAHPEAGLATLATPIQDARDVFDPNVVKVVLATNGLALYFSRAPIPWARDHYASGAPSAIPAGVTALRHLGLYAYRAGTLCTLSATPPHPLELAESLEQLRALVHGIPIHVTSINEAPGHGVDTEDDLQRVASVLGRHRPSMSDE